MTSLSEYIDLMMEQAGTLWGEEEAEGMRHQIEATASAVWRNNQIQIEIETEPATRLSHRDQP